MRTSTQIKAEIEERFGFFPPFFEPALSTPDVLENLWQQTLSAYVNNPLPAIFKETLFAYLSRYCSVPYCIVCHSCALRPLGILGKDVLKLIAQPPPKTPQDLDTELETLSQQHRIHLSSKAYGAVQFLCFFSRPKRKSVVPNCVSFWGM